MVEGSPAAVDADGSNAETADGADGPNGEATHRATPSLLVWAAGTFHAAGLVVLLVAALHLADAAGDVLAGLGTVPGALVYLYLWALVTWTTRRALAASGVTAADPPDGRAALLAGGIWGGATGVLFFGGLFLAVAAFLVLTAGIGAVPVALLVGLVGGLLAVLVGAVVGVLFALVDLALLRAAVALDGGA